MKLNIETDNSAFEDPNELPKILRSIARDIEEGRTFGIIRDTNGNRVGSWEL